MQWAGKNALPTIHREFPELMIFQSEQECGDGSNSWSYTGYCWQLMKDYFRNGARAYMYWNISTDQGGMSTWGWPQNSLVSVDTTAKTFHYNPRLLFAEAPNPLRGCGSKKHRANGHL